MGRSAFTRGFQAAVVVVTAVLVVWAIATHTASFLVASLVFAALVLCAEFLRIEGDDSSVTFDAPVILGAIAVYHDPAAALLAVALGSGAHAVYRGIVAKRVSLTAFHDAALRALSYFVLALLYASAVDREARPAAKVSGYILLLIGYLVANLVTASLRRYFEGDSAPVDVRRALVAQAKTLLLLSPIVAIEVMLHAAWGIGGFVLGSVPVLVVAYAMGREIESERQNADLVKRNRDLSLLTESSTQILSAEDDQETLRRLMSLLTKLAKMKACAVVTWDPGAESSTRVYRFGECEPSDQDILRWVDSAGFAESAPSRAFVFQNELRRFPLSSGAATQVLIGIQTPEVIYGILIFETEDFSILKAGSLNLLTLLVNQTALSLQDQLLRREMREKQMQLESQAETMSTILDVGTSLIGSFNLDGALTQIAQAVRRALGFQVVVVGLYDAKSDEFVRRAQAGLDDVWEQVRKKRLPAADIKALFRAEFRISASYYVPSSALQQSEHDFFLRSDESFARAEEWDENDILIMPLISGTSIVGFLSARLPSDRRIPTLGRVRNLEMFGVQAVQALQSTQQYEKIEKLSHTDALTPAYNHRYFQDTLSKEINRHSRTGQEFALAMLDLDNFKRINDTYGHPVGDEILKGVVDELMSNARDADVVARYGGEEFAIVFPHTPLAAARDAANRLRELVAARSFAVAAVGKSLSITVSIGLAVYPRDGVNNADLISRADAALYHAKKSGRNRVATAAEAVDASQIAL